MLTRVQWHRHSSLLTAKSIMGSAFQEGNFIVYVKSLKVVLIFLPSNFSFWIYLRELILNLDEDLFTKWFAVALLTRGNLLPNGKDRIAL